MITLCSTHYDVHGIDFTKNLQNDIVLLGCFACGGWANDRARALVATEPKLEREEKAIKCSIVVCDSESVDCLGD
jgi:hypothetical protein